MQLTIQQIKRKFPEASTIFAAFFVVVMLDGLYITDANYLQLSVIRLYLTFLIGGLTVYLLSRPNKELIGYSFVHFLLLCYGFIMSNFFGGGDYFLNNPKLVLYLLISLGFGYSIASYFLVNLSSGNKVTTSAVIPAFFIGSLFYVFFSGAIVFGSLPYFNFEGIGKDYRSYSQSTSALFGIASLYFLLSSYKKSLIRALVLLVISFFCLYLSAMGGGRGDFGVALILYCAILLRHRTLFSYFTLFLVVGIVVYVVFNNDMLDNFLVINRFLSLYETGTFGERDTLLIQSFSLIYDNVFCFVGGCGFNFFQYYFNYEFGMYPHNVVAEFLITFGFVIFVPFFYFVVKGFWLLWRNAGVDVFFFYFVTYTLLINLKSGSLIGFMSLPVLLFFAFVPYFYSANNKAQSYSSPMQVGNARTGGAWGSRRSAAPIGATLLRSGSARGRGWRR